ncbi:glycosyltransferase family 2 protein [Sinisalibacter aestuarii]|uniref:Glycosyl transferase n=1 Tax=Sinisalibacter aestuarii TaxID=2949426 RepID=A0ABQ5LNJ2_9RHOB|nr:glycosyltransferase family 2 protein [Sinisalibacter aestuarii]GKY86528.1 glycosyl transferase [Sinisalibacter aestuarii]
MRDPVRLSCIVPAYNEAPRIAAVLTVLLACENVDEIIVVDDGSSDGTDTIVEEIEQYFAKLSLVRQLRNGGKTRAVMAGLLAARGEYVLLLDSDLVGLAPSDIDRLIVPVLSGRAMASLSLRRNAPKPWHWLGVDYISGERVMPRAVLADRMADLDRLPRFGLEVFMNRLWIAADMNVAVVPWPGVTSPMKYEKRGRMRGLMADLGMLHDIFRTIGPIAAIAQIIALRALRV